MSVATAMMWMGSASSRPCAHPIDVSDDAIQRFNLASCASSDSRRWSSPPPRIDASSSVTPAWQLHSPYSGDDDAVVIGPADTICRAQNIAMSLAAPLSLLLLPPKRDPRDQGLAYSAPSVGKRVTAALSGSIRQLKSGSSPARWIESAAVGACDVAAASFCCCCDDIMKCDPAGDM